MCVSPLDGLQFDNCVDSKTFLLFWGELFLYQFSYNVQLVCALGMNYEYLRPF